jgi:hypothetical protein
MSDAKSSKTGAKHKRKKKPSNHATIGQIVGLEAVSGGAAEVEKGGQEKGTSLKDAPIPPA